MEPDGLFQILIEIIKETTMARHKFAGERNAADAAPKRTRLNIKTGGQGIASTPARKAGRRSPSRQAALNAWIEFTAMVLACGHIETILAEWDNDPRASITPRPAALGGKVVEANARGV
jgi:hypothetical protein